MSVLDRLRLRALRHETGFSIFPDGRGHWCARKGDGIVAGVFFNRDAAIRFARRESLDWPAPKPGIVRNEVSL